MYIYGKNSVKNALENDSVKQAFLYQNFDDKDILDKLISKKIKLNYMKKHDLDKMEKGNHQGIILETDDYKYKELKDIIGKEIIVLLDHIEDPHNLGAIIRTAYAAGITSIIIPKDRSAKVNGTVSKVSTGMTEYMDIVMVGNLVGTIKRLKNSGYWIIGADMNGEDFKTIDYSGKIVLVIGSEGKGMSKLVKENCDFLASIPMKEGIDSLNASVSAALFMYEAVRNR